MLHYFTYFFSLFLLCIGFYLSIKTLEAIGFMLIAGTFIPFPSDIYVLNSVNIYSNAIFFSIICGASNAIAVLFERYFVIELLSLNKNHKIQHIFGKSKLSHYFIKYPAITLFIAGSSIESV